MIEEGFVRLYAHDFTALAARAESGSEVELMVQKRIADLRGHAELMDTRKGEGHLPAVIERLRHESTREDVRMIRAGEDIAGALARRREFLQRIADLLDTPPPAALKTMAVRG